MFAFARLRVCVRLRLWLRACVLVCVPRRSILLDSAARFLRFRPSADGWNLRNLAGIYVASVTGPSARPLARSRARARALARTRTVDFTIAALLRTCAHCTDDGHETCRRSTVRVKTVLMPEMREEKTNAHARTHVHRSRPALDSNQGRRDPPGPSQS